MSSTGFVFYAAKCEDVLAPNDGTLVLYSNGTTTYAEYSCEEGFTISNSEEIMCSQDGTWTMDTPSCGETSVFSLIYRDRHIC